MDKHQVRRCWNDNADAWTALARAGYDVYRDYLNTPAFLSTLPEVQGLRGLDIGCGEGHNTRQVAHRGALMWGIDIAERFIAHARTHEDEQPLGITYLVAGATELPLANASFDFAVAFMSLMDMPDLDRVATEVWRILRPGAFCQFSISHPCTNTRHRRNLRDVDGQTYALELGGYFDDTEGRVETWLFGAAPEEEKVKYQPFRVPRFHRPLQVWFNTFVQVGFRLEMVHEPSASDAAVRECPDMQDSQVMPYFLHLRWRKPL